MAFVETHATSLLEANSVTGLPLVLQIDPAKRTTWLLLCSFSAASCSEVIFLAGVQPDRPVTGAEFVAKIAPAAQAWIARSYDQARWAEHDPFDRNVAQR